jgi:UDP:flavonoid glycosyltransferase YjiC (YdhE family)
VRRLSTTTQQSLVADLRTILAPQYAIRARQFAGQMSKPADSVTNAADLLENLADLRCMARGRVHAEVADLDRVASDG